MTITRTPEIEALLRHRAEQEGQDASMLADSLIASALATDPDDLSPEDVAEIRAGIRRGLDDCAAGRIKPLEVWAAEVRSKYSLPVHLTDEELAEEGP